MEVDVELNFRYVFFEVIDIFKGFLYIVGYISLEFRGNLNLLVFYI